MFLFTLFFSFFFYKIYNVVKKNSVFLYNSKIAIFGHKYKLDINKISPLFLIVNHHVNVKMMFSFAFDKLYFLFLNNYFNIEIFIAHIL